MRLLRRLSILLFWMAGCGGGADVASNRDAASSTGADLDGGLAGGDASSPSDGGRPSEDGSTAHGDGGGVDPGPTLALGPGLHESVELDVGGVPRTTHVVVPEGDGPRPLVILLHGNGGSADQILGLDGGVAPFSEWLEIAAEERLVLAVPDGVAPEGTRARGWNDCRVGADGNPDTDDVLVLETLVGALVRGGMADADQVFAVGHSNGGHMLLRVALEAPALLDAGAVIAAAMPEDGASACEDTGEPVPFLVMNGDEDPILPFEGGEMAGGRGRVLSFEATVGRWVDRNDLTADPTVETIDRTIDGELFETRIERRLFGGPSGHPVAVYRVVGGGHGEPSIEHTYRPGFEAIIGKQSHDLEMAREVWAFFEGL